MQGFPAFRQTGRHADPNLFFSDLLPMVDNLAELKVTLHLFWLIAGGRRLRYARLDELVNDERLLWGWRHRRCRKRSARHAGARHCARHVAPSDRPAWKRPKSGTWSTAPTAAR